VKYNACGLKTLVFFKPQAWLRNLLTKLSLDLEWVSDFVTEEKKL
jgi:hypothetical protein